MSDGISDTFATQLQQMRADAIAHIRAQRGGKIGRAEAAANSRDQQTGDWSQDNSERDLTIALDERETAVLNTIEAALKRWADGSYGLCITCGTSIPTARLHANPTAERCVTCQETHERNST
jgi:DnaK suppressor protein